MEISEAWINVASFLLTFITCVILVARKMEKAESRIDLVNQDLQNHKQLHTNLDSRVTAYEDRVDRKLDGMQKDIGEMKGDIKAIRVALQIEKP